MESVSKNSCQSCNPVQKRDTRYEIRATSDEIRIWAKRAGIHNQNPKKIKFFYNFLTLCPTTTYLFSVSSVSSVTSVAKKLCVLSGLCGEKAVLIRVHSWLQYWSWTKRAAIYNQIPKKIKKFLHSLTLYPTTTYLFSAFSAFSAVNGFFDQTRSFAPL